MAPKIATQEQLDQTAEAAAQKAFERFQRSPSPQLSNIESQLATLQEQLSAVTVLAQQLNSVKQDQKETRESVETLQTEVRDLKQEVDGLRRTLLREAQQQTENRYKLVARVNAQNTADDNTIITEIKRTSEPQPVDIKKMTSRNPSPSPTRRFLLVYASPAHAEQARTSMRAARMNNIFIDRKLTQEQMELQRPYFPINRLLRASGQFWSSFDGMDFRVGLDKRSKPIRIDLSEFRSMDNLPTSIDDARLQKLLEPLLRAQPSTAGAQTGASTQQQPAQAAEQQRPTAAAAAAPPPPPPPAAAAAAAAAPNSSAQQQAQAPGSDSGDQPMSPPRSRPASPTTGTSSPRRSQHEPRPPTSPQHTPVTSKTGTYSKVLRSPVPLGSVQQLSKRNKTDAARAAQGASAGAGSSSAAAGTA